MSTDAFPRLLIVEAIEEAPAPFAAPLARAGGNVHRVLWMKCFRDAWWPMIGATLLLTVFTWLFMSLLSTVDVAPMLQFLPKYLTRYFEQMVGMPIAVLGTPLGQISAAYVDAITIFTCVAWAILRGSDCIAGELGRGTLEFMLAQPVRRGTLLAVHTLVTIFGCVVIIGGLLTGTALGLASTGANRDIPWTTFLPGAINLFFFMLCLTTCTTFFSAFTRERYKPIGYGVAFFVISLLMKIVSRIWEPGQRLIYFTFIGAVEPQRLILAGEQAWLLSLKYNAILLGISALAYIGAWIVFAKRDLPPPL